MRISMKRFGTAIFTILSSGSCFYFASANGEAGILMWVAAIPILLYVYYEHWIAAILVAFLIGLTPGLYQTLLYAGTIIPLQEFIYSALSQSLLWTAIILISGFLIKRINNPLASFAYPCSLALLEWLQSLGPSGTFNTFAYSQMHYPLSLQIASLTGFFGITFMTAFFSSGIAQTIIFRKQLMKALTCLTITLIITIVSLAYGHYRLETINQEFSHNPHLAVGITDISLPPSETRNPNNALKIINSYENLMAPLVKQGAEVILWPEESISVNSTNRKQIQEYLAKLARQNQVQLIVGVNDIFATHKRHNSAWVFSSGGTFLGQYNKRHLVPVVEDSIVPEKTFLPFILNNISSGIAICRDMDYPDPAQYYGHMNTKILFVPAWDFDIDAWAHAVGAIMRGVENGYTVVRSARNGYLSVSSPSGEILALNTSFTDQQTSLFFNVPTVSQASWYAQYPYWFAKTLIALFVLLVIMACRRK